MIMEKNELEIGGCSETCRDCNHCGTAFGKLDLDMLHEECEKLHEGCEKLHEECGVFGVYSYSEELAVAPCVYHGLVALQHRGQESCGIAVSDRGVFKRFSTDCPDKPLSVMSATPLPAVPCVKTASRWLCVISKASSDWRTTAT